MVFTFNAETEITPEVVSEFIKKHRAKIPEYEKLKNLYLSNHEILTQTKKAEYKPDNRLVANHAKYLVDTFNGFFIGNPVKISSESDAVSAAIKKIRSRNNMDDNESEMSKLCDIYGHCYEYLYQNEQSLTDATYFEPQNGFVVYDDTIAQKPLFGVYYQIKEDILTGKLFTRTEDINLGGTADSVAFKESAINPFNDVPIIEWVENAERQSLLKPVETLINAVNKVLSEKANDVDYFADAYLKILGVSLDEETIQKLRDNRTINFNGADSDKIIVEFLQKPSADETQEHLLDRIINFIYELSMVANISDEKFGNASGVALEYRLLPMKNMALNKERKVKAAMRLRHKLFFSLPTNVPASEKDNWTNLTYTFTRNLPRNIKEEIDNAVALSSIASDETALRLISVIEDPKAEIEKNKKELTVDGAKYDFNQTTGVS